MDSRNTEWIGSLCALLSILCTIQSIVAGILLWCIPEVLTLTKGHKATIAGLIAGFVTLPAVIRFNSAQMSPNLDRTYGYTLSYQRLTLSVAGALHFIAVVLAIVALATVENFGQDFIKLIADYDRKPQAKALVDNIQYILECCGGYSYKDWHENAPRHRVDQADKKELCLSGLDEGATLKSDEVPFSCCSRNTSRRCKYENLQGISTNGCGCALRHFVSTLLWIEFGFYGICFCLEAVALILLVEDRGTDASDPEQRVECLKSEEWGNFSNGGTSNAIIWPSSHSEMKIELTE